MPQLPLLVLNMQKWSWEGQPAVLNLKVVNKVVIKITWEEWPCQEERQRHKSLSLFKGLCPFMGGRQPQRLLAPIPCAQRAGLFVVLVMKRGRVAVQSPCPLCRGTWSQEHPHTSPCSSPTATPQPCCRLAGGTAAGRASPVLCSTQRGDDFSGGSHPTALHFSWRG